MPENKDKREHPTCARLTPRSKRFLEEAERAYTHAGVKFSVSWYINLGLYNLNGYTNEHLTEDRNKEKGGDK